MSRIRLVTSFSLALVAAAGLCLAQTPDGWTARQPPQYVNRSGSIGVSGKIFVFGSDGSNGSPSSRAYNAASNQWATLAPTPIPVAAPAVAAVNGLIYVIGGYNPANGGEYSPSPNQVYNPSTDSWSSAASPSVARSFASAQAVGGKIYLIGGCVLSCVSKTSETEQFDPATAVWTTMASMRTSRGGMGSVVAGGLIYVIGGGDSNGVYLTTTETYDPSTNVWTTKAPMPTARGEFGAALQQGKIYAFGGVNPGGYLSTNEVYDPSSDTWAESTPLPVTMGGNTGAVAYGSAYSIGCNRSDSCAQQANYRLDRR